MPKASKHTKVVVVSVRFAEDHERVMKQMAERAGLCLSAWLRQAALKAAGVIR